MTYNITINLRIFDAIDGFCLHALIIVVL